MESAIAAVLLIATGKAGVRATGRRIFRERVLEFHVVHVDGEERKAYRSPSGETPLWERLIGGQVTAG
ncbi:hypothetical protein SAMN05216371_0423 [Streptomyces sp. TLI_053]|uniref:hypothetical protein n=1 Tax=Streptomyces sp. TLI_053 TaxID=1855352 RepID=UPI00087D6FD1|nr:hypothetical protein [Streptomyces sp. TLI_053]SDS69190.1 hypothetical protein SAMN05216371_0423 [Streptomyces sp. TLI_053]